MAKTTVEDAIKTMTVLKQTGLKGPLMMDLSHPIFRMAMTWGTSAISHANGEFDAPPILSRTKIPHFQSTRARSTTSITNQHGAILVDSYVDVSVTIAPEETVRGTITRHNLVCGNNVYRSYEKTDEFTLTPYGDTATVNVYSHTETAGSFRVNDTAFARFTRAGTKMAATSPVRITRYRGATHSDPMVTVRLKPSSEPFFYALSKAEANRFDNAAGSRSTRTLHTMFKAATNEADLAHSGLPLFVFTEGQLVPEPDGARVAEGTRFAAPETAGIDTDVMRVPFEESSKSRFSLFEIAMNFIHLGVTTMTPKQIVDLDNESNMAPIMFSEGI